MRQAVVAVLTQLDAKDAKLSLDALVRDLPIAQRQIVAICRGLSANARERLASAFAIFPRGLALLPFLLISIGMIWRQGARQAI
jgi:hypothetical protein